jgi:HAD superfamily hydrolase (TIGR01509 family)
MHPSTYPKITAIIFDFGMVLSSFDVGTFLQNLSDITGTPVEQLPPILQNVRDIVVRYETGLISTDEFVESAIRRTGLHLSREQFRKAYNEIFTAIPENRELVRRLKPRYKIGLLSNTSEWHFEHAIKTVDIFPLFDAVTLSFEVKAMKPVPALYRDMLAKLRVTAGECIYIDDIAENATAAANMGMHAIQYVSPAQLVSSLRQLGVSA